MTALWTVTLALAVAGSIYDARRLMFWSIMTGLVSAFATSRVLMVGTVRRERIELERLVDGMIARASERAAEAEANHRAPVRRIK